MSGGLTPVRDNPPLAASLLVSGLFLLGLQDAVIKFTSGDISLWQMQLIRASGNLVLLVLISVLLWRRMPPWPRRLWAVSLRAFLLTCAMLLFFGGVPFLSLSQIAAGLYVFPLFVAILSALVLGEHVGPRRIGAVVVGLVGTLLILKPWTDAFQWVSVMPVGAGLCYAAMILTTRKLCRDEHPVTAAFAVSISFISVGVIGIVVIWAVAPAPDLAQSWSYLLTGWSPLEMWVIGLILSCSLLNLTANLSLTRAYQTAESSWLAPFDYSYLIFATFWGYVVWQHVPDALSFLGMGLIAASGTYVALREAHLAKQMARQTREATVTRNR